MYANENYKWFEDFDEDNWHWLPDSLYWMLKYNKIYRQGRAKDRLKLKELYDSWDEDEYLIIKILTHIFMPSTKYRYAVTQFISDTKYESYKDDRARERKIQDELYDIRHWKRLNKMWGFDVEAYENEVLALETELKKHHDYRQTNFDCDSENLIGKYPSTLEIALTNVVKRGSYDIEYYNNGIEPKYLTVYYELHDKCKGYYSMFLWTADNTIDNVDENGNSLKMVAFGTSLSGEYGLLTWNNLFQAMVKRANIVLDRIRSKRKTLKWR